MRRAVMAFVLATAACSGGPPVATPTSSGTPGTTAVPSKTSRRASTASRSIPAATATSPTTATSGPAASGAARAFGGYCDGDDRYRCVRLSDGLRWWGAKPALVPPGRGEIWVLLHGGSGDGWTSDDHRSAPNLCYVVPDRAFRHIANRNRFDTAVAEGAFYVCNYFTDRAYAPSPSPHTRPVRVRGRDGLLKQGGDYLREVDWSVPAGDGRVYSWLVVDSPKHRSEAELLTFVESLEATAPGA